MTNWKNKTLNKIRKGQQGFRLVGYRDNKPLYTNGIIDSSTGSPMLFDENYNPLSGKTFVYNLPAAEKTSTRKAQESAIKLRNPLAEATPEQVLSASTLGADKWIQPSWYIGMIRRSSQGKDATQDFIYGNTGVVNEGYAEKHPYITTAANLVTDIAVPGAIALGPKVGRAVGRTVGRTVDALKIYNGIDKTPATFNSSIPKRINLEKITVEDPSTKKVFFTNQGYTTDGRVINKVGPYDEMDKVLAYNKAKQNAYGELDNKSMLDIRLKNLKFTPEEIDQVKNLFRKRLKGIELSEGEGEIKGEESGLLRSKLNEKGINPKTVSISLKNINNKNLLETVYHEVLGHARSYSLKLGKQFQSGNPKFYIGVKKELSQNPILLKLNKTFRNIRPRYRRDADPYYKDFEEINARFQSVKEQAKDIIRNSNPDLEFSNPEKFNNEVVKLTDSWYKSRRLPFYSPDLRDILINYHPRDSRLYNEISFSKGGIINLKNLR